jgi:hypothetical protein
LFNNLLNGRDLTGIADRAAQPGWQRCHRALSIRELGIGCP